MVSLLVAAALLLAPVTAFAQAASDGRSGPDPSADPRSGVQIAASAKKEVLVLYATRRDAQIVVIGDRELPRILEKGLPGGLDYYSEFLDHGRFTQPDYRVAFRDFMALKYRGRHFDLVIAMGEIPLAFLADYRDTFAADAPLLYFTDRTDRPAPQLPNSTGVIATPDLGGTLTLATQLQPETENAFVIMGTGGEALLEAARRQLRPFESTMKVTYLVGLPAAELETRLKSLPARSVVYYLLVDRDGSGEMFHPLDYLERVAAVANAPTYSWVDSAMDRGIVGGSLKDQVAQTEAVGTLALRVLNGESAGTIPPLRENLNVVQVDWRQLRRWNISESRVPAGTLIRFREATVWDRFAPFIILAAAVVFAQSALIGALLMQRRGRKQAEAEVIGKQDELVQSYERIRDLGARLLQAQESERSRVARDLHDDISQQMALLEMDLEQLAALVQGTAQDLTTETLHRAQEIGRSVHDLSHRLHPAKLRLIGLVAAVQGLRRELSTQQTTEIAFTHENIPPSIPEELALCLFRIVQEALHNALKYSQARRVSVDLRGGPAGLQLTVVDNGVGFNVDTTWRKGLGLISMRERLEAVGGSIKIHSRPGAGTRLEINVPLRLDPVVAA